MNPVSATSGGSSLTPACAMASDSALLPHADTANAATNEPQTTRLENDLIATLRSS
jgi:hypothetical protein